MSTASSASVLLSEIHKALIENPFIIGKIEAFITAIVRTKDGAETWYLLFRCQSHPPQVTTVPLNPSKDIPEIIIELYDCDIVNLVTGGLTAINAISSKRLKIKGDLLLAHDISRVFVGVGGVERVMMYLKSHKRINQTKEVGEPEYPPDSKFNIRSKL